MKKIALVNQRYGLEVNGGSEYYTRLIAERLCHHYQVDVITTKAIDYTTWENHYSDDMEQINGVTVLRFPTVRERDADFSEFNGEYLQQLNSGKPDISREMTWFEKQGPLSPDAINYIQKHADDYDAFIFVTYLYYLSVQGLPKVKEKAIFIPTAHEEPYIHFSYFNQLFQMPKAFVFLTDEEKDLVHKLFRNSHIPHKVMGVGVDVPDEVDPQKFREAHNLQNTDYLVYVGRIDENKGCPQMFQYFIEYKKRVGGNLKLVLMGKPVCDIPKHPDIICLGFVSEEDKFNGIAGAKLLILPSKFESLSISVLEAMSLNVPVLVNGICEVLKGHCIKSNAGLYYQNYFEFEGALQYICNNNDVYQTMCSNAREYINSYYVWDVIMQNFTDIIENII